MRKILVPVDFSDASENVFVYALEMAKLYKAELLSLHTFELPILDSQIVPFNYAEIYDAIEMSNFNHFNQELRKFKAMAKAQNAEHIVMNHKMMVGELLINYG